MEFKSLFKNDIPLIDVRAPIEFEAGHFPQSVNFPLMNNEERRLVGIKYKESGQEAAIKLGHELINGKIKEERVSAWFDFKKKNPNAKLYCFRGGLRSQISRQWLEEAGMEIEIIPGGYKALRRYLIDTIQISATHRKFLVIAGRTGSGKTGFFKKTETDYIDLEKHANHRGSSFGIMGPQPSQITFENRIAVDFLKNDHSPITLLEDESIMIGSMVIPGVLFQAMKVAPLVVLEKPLEERVDHIVKEYVIESNQTLAFMQEALNRIKKKLGGLNHALISKHMMEAFQSPEKNTVAAHRIWVECLLIHYYDSFYDKALIKNASRIAFRGNEQECLEYIREQK